MLTLSIIAYFIAAIYFYRVIDSAWEISKCVEDKPSFWIPAFLMFVFYPIVLLIGITSDTIKAKHFILAVTSFFKD